MKKQSRNKTFSIIRIAFLYFAIMVVGFVFMCTDSEYNYNQQIARGFISHDSVFFVIDNPSYGEAFFMTVSVSDGESIDSSIIDTSPIEATEDSFELENRIQSDGHTAVETLLSSGSGDYMASLHNGVMRGLAYKGPVLPPPLLTGRFFTEEECLSDYPLAVIGSNYKESLISRDGKQYLEYMDRDYEVIGIVGLSAASPIDDVIFVNLGSLTPKEQLDGSYYVDCSTRNETIYSELEAQSELLFGCGLKRRETPTAFIDVVAGGMYLKSYLKVLLVLLGIIAFLNVLIQSVKETYVEISVMKILGIKLRSIFLKTIKKKIIAFVIGLISGIVVDVGLILLGVFSLPIKWLINYGVIILSLGVLLMLIWILTVLVIEWKLNPKEVIQRI